MIPTIFYDYFRIMLGDKPKFSRTEVILIFANVARNLACIKEFRRTWIAIWVWPRKISVQNDRILAMKFKLQKRRIKQYRKIWRGQKAIEEFSKNCSNYPKLTNLCVVFLPFHIPNVFIFTEELKKQILIFLCNH